MVQAARRGSSRRAVLQREDSPCGAPAGWTLMSSSPDHGDLRLNAPVGKPPGGGAQEASVQAPKKACYYSQLILFLGTMPRLWPGFISAKNTIRDKIQLVLIFFFKVPISLDNDIGMLYNSTNRRC